MVLCNAYLSPLSFGSVWPLQEQTTVPCRILLSNLSRSQEDHSIGPNIYIYKTVCAFQKKRGGSDGFAQRNRVPRQEKGQTEQRSDGKGV